MNTPTPITTEIHIDRMREQINSLKQERDTAITQRNNLKNELVDLKGKNFEQVYLDACMQLEKVKLEYAKKGMIAARKIAQSGTCDGYPDCGSPICERNEEIAQDILEASERLTIEQL